MGKHMRCLLPAWTCPDLENLGVATSQLIRLCGEKRECPPCGISVLPHSLKSSKEQKQPHEANYVSGAATICIHVNQLTKTNCCGTDC